MHESFSPQDAIPVRLPIGFRDSSVWEQPGSFGIEGRYLDRWIRFAVTRITEALLSQRIDESLFRRSRGEIISQSFVKLAIDRQIEQCEISTTVGI